MNANELKIKACIGNYGYYAEGQLRDKWVTLPMKPADLDAWLEDNCADCYFDFRAYAENELMDYFVGDSGYTVEGPDMNTYSIDEAAEIIGMKAA